MTLGLVYDDSVMSKLLKASYGSSTDRNPYINWCSETTVCLSMALHDIFGQISEQILISAANLISTGIMHTRYISFDATKEIMNGNVMLLYF